MKNIPPPARCLEIYKERKATLSDIQADPIWLKLAGRIIEQDLGDIRLDNVQEQFGLSFCLTIDDLETDPITLDVLGRSPFSAHNTVILAEKMKAVETLPVQLKEMIVDGSHPDWFLSLCIGSLMDRITDLREFYDMEDLDECFAALDALTL